MAIIVNERKVDAILDVRYRNKKITSMETERHKQIEVYAPNDYAMIEEKN